MEHDINREGPKRQPPKFPGGKPYYSLNGYLRETFGGGTEPAGGPQQDGSQGRPPGGKIYKLALDGGMTCPNRDGTLGTEGCIFCSHGGSGDFAEARCGSVLGQIEAAKERVAGKMKDGRYIAYFQSYTNTYAPVSYLEPLFTEAVSHPDVAALSIGTRPDCLPEDVIALLKRLNRIKPVWVELGLQTIHEETAALIRRGYPLSCFTEAVTRLKEAGLTVIVHVILGLPGETREMMFDTVRFLGHFKPEIDGIKLQLLHILKGTKLAALYEAAPFPVMAMDEYLDLILCCVRLLPPSMVIHRLSGDGPKKLLIAPAWSGNKRLFLNSLAKAFRETGAYQGEWFSTPPEAPLPPRPL